jgi:hypothetical protein
VRGLRTAKRFFGSEQRRCDEDFGYWQMLAPDEAVCGGGVLMQAGVSFRAAVQPTNRTSIVSKRRPAIFASISESFALQRSEQILLSTAFDSADSASDDGARDTAALRPSRLRERRSARSVRRGGRRLWAGVRRNHERCAASRGDSAA